MLEELCVSPLDVASILNKCDVTEPLISSALALYLVAATIAEGEIGPTTCLIVTWYRYGYDRHEGERRDLQCPVAEMRQT